MDLVRASNDAGVLGFVSHTRRLNVLVTRQQIGLWIVADERCVLTLDRQAQIDNPNDEFIPSKDKSKEDRRNSKVIAIFDWMRQKGWVVNIDKGSLTEDFVEFPKLKEDNADTDTWVSGHARRLNVLIKRQKLGLWIVADERCVLSLAQQVELNDPAPDDAPNPDSSETKQPDKSKEDGKNAKVIAAFQWMRDKGRIVNIDKGSLTEDFLEFHKLKDDNAGTNTWDSGDGQGWGEGVPAEGPSAPLTAAPLHWDIAGDGGEEVILGADDHEDAEDGAEEEDY